MTLPQHLGNTLGGLLDRLPSMAQRAHLRREPSGRPAQAQGDPVNRAGAGGPGVRAPGPAEFAARKARLC